MKVATKSMCEEKNPTVSIIAPLHSQLLSDTVISPNETPVVKGLKTAIHGDLARRYNTEKEKGFLYVATFLDPRFKAMSFLSAPDVLETAAMVVSKAAALMVITS